MGIQELKQLEAGNIVRSNQTNEEYQILMKFQYSVNCYLGSGKSGHKRIGETNMNEFDLVKR
ncbi:MAG: hypothetical protein K0R00_102 [Herbinix sp.]|jgi:hypothetical protein|nr:hypothetical protein [Herbinix sp.]